jgi:hypothetical protein
MSIDGIGKKGPVVPPQQIGGAQGAEAPKGAFKVERTERAQAAEASSPAAEVRAGRMTLDSYLDHRISDATQHLKGLGPADMQMIRETLKSEMKNDPALADLVKNATGAMPEAD